MAGDRHSRAFSERRHAAGGWGTRVSHARFGPIRRLWGFVSLKRRGVDRLAAGCPADALVLDLGCGKGAYSHWFLGRRAARMVAVDWSPAGLGAVGEARRGSIAVVCADARRLPFKECRFDAVFSIDMLGHVAEHDMVLDELVRVSAPGAHLFIHSECADSHRRWPDKALLRRLATDAVGDIDGHVGVPQSIELRRAFARRFAVEWFAAPAGILGWLLGYPEKYRPAFARAGYRGWAAVTGVFALLKRMPVVGALMRLVNAVTNHLELFLGLTGGGSCFALLRRTRSGVDVGTRTAVSTDRDSSISWPPPSQ